MPPNDHGAYKGPNHAARVSGWAEQTLSLDYFQPATNRFDSPRLAGLPLVRRATGGAALVPHHEDTCGLALPPVKPWQAGDESWG